MTATKQKLVDTASHLIHTMSYGSVSVDEICKKAVVNKGSFYHFFKSKSDLAVACMDVEHADMIAVMNDLFSPIKPAMQRFDDLVKFMVNEQEELLAETGMVCGCGYTSLGSEAAGIDEQINKRVQMIMSDCTRFYRTGIRDLVADGTMPTDTDIDAVAHTIFTFFTGIMATARITNSLDCMESNMRQGVYRILGVKTNNETLEQAAE